MTKTSEKIMGNKLEKEELTSMSRLLRGKRLELANRAKVSIATVNSVFEGRSSNEDVLKTALLMVKEAKEQKVNPVIVEIREELRELE